MISENGVVIPTRHVQATICALARQFEAVERENNNLHVEVKSFTIAIQERDDRILGFKKALAVAATSLQEAGAEIGSLRSWKAAGEETINQLKLAMVELRALLEEAAHSKRVADTERILATAAARIGEAIG